MAFFDPHEQRLCVNVVYDGAAGAGKTTNMHQLASLFASRAPNRVETSHEVEGRTLFFDWLQIRAGLVAGVPLLCQIVSVPGQVALTPRRRHLLATADVVVFVCDSRPGHLGRAREGLAVLREIVSERGVDVPLILQPNHQDGKGALAGAEIAKELGLSHVTRVDAIASEGIGVVDTFVAAIRDLSRQLRDRAARADLHLEVRRASTRASLLDQVAALAVDPEAAAEMLLEEASANFLLRELDEGMRRPTEERDRTPGERETVRVPRSSGVLLPTPDVPAGFIWPAHTGRDTLRRIAERARLGMRARSLDDGTTYEVKAEGYVFHTRDSSRFETAEESRQALVRGARERAQLDQLTLPDSVLVASEGGEGGYYVWSLVPEVEPLRESLLRVSDSSTLRRWLEAYGNALAEASRFRERYGLDLSTSLNDFGFRGERLRYLGEIGHVSSHTPSMQSVIAIALAEVERGGWDASVVRAAFDCEVLRRASPEDLGVLRRGGPFEIADGTAGATTLSRPRPRSNRAEDH